MDKNNTYIHWLRSWIQVYKKPYIKSWKLIQAHVRIHIPTSLKQSKLKDLCALDIQRAINNIETSRTRLEMYDIYHSSLKMAYRIGILDRDIADLLIKPKHTRVVGNALSKEELTVFFDKIKGHKCELYYKFLLYTGCRRCEALSLTWNDIDVDNMLIHVRGTKTVCSNRYIPILPEVYNEILLMLPLHKNKLFYFRPDYVTKTFHKFMPTHKLHDLRHTFATRCMECGISINVVSHLLGHSCLDTTSRIYTHVLPDFIKSETNKFNLGV